jgi:hypothetical protein
MNAAGKVAIAPAYFDGHQADFNFAEVVGRFLETETPS